MLSTFSRRKNYLGDLRIGGRDHIYIRGVYICINAHAHTYNIGGFVTKCSCISSFKDDVVIFSVSQTALIFKRCAYFQDTLTNIWH